MKARRKKASKGDQLAAQSSSPDLPICVVMEILCRLPIKTLMAAKCVCKSWLELISADTHFAKLHLSRSPTELLLKSANNRSDSTRLYWGNIDFHKNSVSRFMSSSPLFDLPSLNGRTMITPLYLTDLSELFYVNTCNGLVCFCNTYHAPCTYAMICNPITGEFITVAGPAKEEKGFKCTVYGLGFSAKENRYKVLRVLFREPVASRLYEQFVEICTIEKGSSWRNLGDCPYLIGGVRSKDFVYLEGKLHFLTQHSSMIACFDFDSEQFQEVPLPPISADKDHRIGRIGVFEGCLYLTIAADVYSSDVWVMKEYDVKDSWTKAFAYPCLCGLGVDRPLKYLANGDILMILLHSIDSYNPVTIFEPVVSVTGLQVVPYRPSLLRFKDVLMGYDALVLNAKPRRREQVCEGSSSSKG